MRLVSWNVNGLRAVAKRSFLEWLDEDKPDVLCLQEIKVDSNSLPESLASIPGYYGSFSFADRKGYAGVAVYTRTRPVVVRRDIMPDPDRGNDGRTILAEFDEFAVLNVYMPHGSRDKSRLVQKLSCYDRLLDFVDTWIGNPLVIAGDLNVAHEESDLAHPKQNRNNVMFTPDERAKLTALIDRGYIDTFRRLNPTLQAFTWWPYMASARERDIGWRIDYILADRSFETRISEARIMGDVAGSDHCPISMSLRAVTDPPLEIANRTCYTSVQ